MSKLKEAKAIELFEALEQLFVDEDLEINGGDLVQAISHCVGDEFEWGMQLIEEIMEG